MNSLFVVLIYIDSKYTWVFHSKHKKGITITNTFQKILNESGHKTNKIWNDNGTEFCNRLIKSWLQDNHVEMYLTHNEGKSVVAERFVRTLKNRIYKHVTLILKNVYFD